MRSSRRLPAKHRRRRQLMRIRPCRNGRRSALPLRRLLALPTLRPRSSGATPSLSWRRSRCALPLKKNRRVVSAHETVVKSPWLHTDASVRVEEETACLP